MSLFVPPRQESDELLDEADAPRAEMERSLRDLRRFNKYLGGIGLYKRLLRLTVRDCRSVIDIGSGTADLIAATQIPFRVAVDFKIQHLQYGRQMDKGRTNIYRVVADGFRLPFRDGAADVVTSAHFFHHFSPEENIAMLGEALRVSRRAVAVNDTRRNIFPLAFVRVLASLNLVGEITKLDAPASVRQGYTMEEAEAVARKTPARQHEVRRLAPFRFGLILWK